MLGKFDLIKYVNIDSYVIQMLKKSSWDIFLAHKYSIGDSPSPTVDIVQRIIGIYGNFITVKYSFDVRTNCDQDQDY